jgi:soluble lytic murein transglycosylase-like protein
MPRTSRHLLVLLAAAVIAVAGCGEVEPTDPGEPDAAPTPEAVTSPTPTGAPSPRPAAVPEHDREAASGEPIPARSFADPDELAEQLVAAERAIRDEETPGDDLRAWAWTQQMAYRDLALNPDWVDEVRAAVPGELRDAFDANVHATARLRAMTDPRDDLPEWRIVEPPPADELRGYYRAAAEEYGVDWEVLASIHLVETRMGRIRGVSVAGAQGPMQFMPATWAAYGEGDVDDPHDAIRAAARYLARYGAPDDMRSAVFAYNRSENYVDAILAYADVMREDERAYDGYYHWRIYYRLSAGDVILPEGFDGS